MISSFVDGCVAKYLPDGATLDERDLLKRVDSGSQMDSAQPFNILIEILSGPDAAAWL